MLYRDHHFIGARVYEDGSCAFSTSHRPCDNQQGSVAALARSFEAVFAVVPIEMARGVSSAAQQWDPCGGKQLDACAADHIAELATHDLPEELDQLIQPAPERALPHFWRDEEVGFFDYPPEWQHHALAILRDRAVCAFQEANLSADSSALAGDRLGGALPVECLRSLPGYFFSPHYLRVLACVSQELRLAVGDSRLWTGSNSVEEEERLSAVSCPCL